ncbi:BTAD domain-containing putative transcriptional regulator [Lentzea sp. NEAU-D7]|uniref:BTAD domain-containing putative transcriptional regulator n=1 Tax=Lentzea sp. NEAU-D7 TaxID=2994667 RepID=UPI00224A51AA|nr:BTAD domain-containing putative transcriptional regulator [Lentzea sp. NEAU-D7]MCX2948579.1 BTAD domain-containing putative transcriptional regulator [Lentzea sp. NEAU-D7]
MIIRLLGPLELTGPNGAVQLSSAGQRTLVARLALNPGETVPRSALVDALWSDEVPASATKTLHSLLARLRGQIRDAGLGELITTREPGYVLNAPADTVDAARFEALVAAARHSDEPLASAKLLREALALWTGDPLADCRPGEWTRHESARLIDLRMDATEELMEASLALGEHAAVAPLVNALVERHPFRERLWEQLMIALYRSGRQAESLAAFQRARSVLVDELGIEPGPRLRDLEQAVLTADPRLDLPERTPVVVRGNLPADRSSFVDRPETAHVADLIRRHRLVTLTGVGGVGKTRLAMHVARGEKPPDGVWLVELAALRDRALVPHTVAEALGVVDQTGRGQLTVLTEFLAGKDALLVLDNCEHVVDHCAVLVDTLLRVAPNLRVIATSRRALRVYGEQVMSVAPLSVPYPAATLFAQRADAAIPGSFVITAANEQAVSDLCRRLDGIPLAIEMAAMRVRALTPAQLLERLDDRFRVLTDGGRTALPQHQTLLATMEWSFDLCSPREQLLWARASVFAGSFDLAAAEAVCSDDSLTADFMFDAVDGLVEKSVLQREERAGVARYRLLETMRQFGQTRLRAGDEEPRLKTRHRDWYAGIALQGEQAWFTPRQVATVAAMAAERGNLRAALEHSLTTPGEADAGLRLAATLWFYWVGCGRFAEGRHWLNWALSLETEPSRARCKALWVTGYLATLQGNTSAVPALLEACRAEAAALGDEDADVYATYVQGAAAVFDDDLPLGARLLAEADRRHAELGHMDSNVVMARVALAITVAFGGELDRAAEICTKARLVCEENGELWARAFALYVLAFVAMGRGDVVEARELAVSSLRIKEKFNDLLGIAVSVELLALISVVTGSASHAALLLGGADRVWQSVGLPLFGSANFAASHDHCVALCRQALGPEAYEDHFSRGAAMTVPAVVAAAQS